MDNEPNLNNPHQNIEAVKEYRIDINAVLDAANNISRLTHVAEGVNEDIPPDVVTELKRISGVLEKEIENYFKSINSQS